MTFGQRRKRARTVLYKYFAVILAICSAVLIFSTLVSYRLLERVIVRQVYEKSVERLEQVRSVFDAVHFSVIPAAVQLSEDRLVNALMYSAELSASEVLRALDRLDIAKLGNPIVDSIVVYNHLLETMYSTETGVTLRTDYSDQELLAMLDDARSYGLYRYIPREIEGRGVFTLLLGAPPTTGNRLKGATILNISERELRSLFSSSTATVGGELIIYDRHGTVLSHSDPSRFSTDESSRELVVPLLRSEAERGTYIANADGIRSLVTFIRNAEFGWRFVTVTPYGELLAEVDRTRNLVLTLLSAVFAGSVFAAYFVSRRLYQPIGSMQSFARHVEREFLQTGPPRLSGNELEYVDTVFHRLSMQTRSLNSYVNRYRANSMREAARIAILTGSVAELESHTPPGSTAYEDTHCCVVVARLDGSADVHARTEYGNIIRSLTMYAEVLARTLETPYPGVEIEPDHVAVLLTEHARKALERRDLRSVLSSLTSWQSTVGILSFTIGIGSLVGSVRDAPISYRSALTATDLRFSKGPGSLFVDRDEADYSESAYQFPDEHAQRLVRAIRSGDETQAIDLIDSILDDRSVSHYRDFLLMTHIVVHRLESVRSGAEGSERLPGLISVRSRVGHFETIEDARSLFHLAIRDLCGAVNESSRNKRSELADTLRGAIEANLTDPNLSSKWLADRFSVSTNYARTLFRDVIGRSISDYINESRIELCKKRLEEQDVHVKQLYRELGFGSYNYFFTLFRKYIGMTPIQYRRTVTTRSLS